MKESEFNDMIARINTTISMDHRVTDHILDYDTTVTKVNNKTKEPNLILNISNSKKRSILSHFTKAAAILILFIVIGTTTALASDFFIHTYQVKTEIVDSSVAGYDDIGGQCPLGDNLDANVQKFGAGSRNFDGDGNLIISETQIIKDGDGNIVEYRNPGSSDTYYDPVKSGDEAFDVFGIPNLTPTFLYDHYFLGEDGYVYSEQKSDNDVTVKTIAAEFITAKDNRYVFIQYTPFEGKAVDKSVHVIDDIDSKDITTSTYTNKGGLICNLVEQKDILTSAEIFMESDTIGDGSLLISFSNIQKDEIYEILDSIPVSTKGTTD